MAKVLCTCPSRGRPELLNKMIKSFINSNTTQADLIVYLDNDDPTLNKYSHSDWCQTIVGNRMNVAQIHNHLIRTNPDYDYYMPINDDITFETPHWDCELINTIEEKGSGWGIAYPNDSTGNHKFNLPTFGMVSANIVKTLGYLYPLELKMMFGDTFLLDIGRALGRLYYRDDVVIKHSPVGYAEGAYVPNDHRMEKGLFKEEQLAYAKYIDNKLDIDVAKLFEAITA